MTNLIRVLVGSWNRIDLDGRLLVEISKSRHEAGKTECAPIGGAMDFLDPARPFLESIGAQFEKPGTNELRLYLPVDNLPIFEKWYHRGQDRETNPFRELHEELVDESGLPDFARDAVTITHRRTIRESYLSSRLGVRTKNTERFGDFFDVRFTPEYDEHIRHGVRQPDSRLGLISEREVCNRVTHAGTAIAEICKYLVG